MPRARNVDLELRAIPAEHGTPARIEIVNMTAHVRQQPATEDRDINAAIVVPIDEHRMRISALLENVLIEPAQDWPALDLDEADDVGLEPIDDTPGVLDRRSLDEVAPPFD